MSYSATIPPQPTGTLVLYTIITSTADLTPYSTSGVIDLADPGNDQRLQRGAADPAIHHDSACRQNGDGGSRPRNFASKPTGTKPLKYQWKKNGTNIAGAISASYKTPPTTLARQRCCFRSAHERPSRKRDQQQCHTNCAMMQHNRCSGSKSDERPPAWPAHPARSEATISAAKAADSA